MTKRSVYPIIISEEKDGLYVLIPDFEMATQGENIADAIMMARDAIGLMGIENIWANAEVEVYNFDNDCWEIFKVDYDKVGKDVDYNIKVGTAIFQSRFNENIKKNIVPPEELLAYTIQSYNMGQGNMNEVSTTGSHWIDSRIMVEGGDKLYFEHVLSRLENDTIINIKQKDGQYLSTKLTNEATKLKTKSL